MKPTEKGWISLKEWNWKTRGWVYEGDLVKVDTEGGWGGLGWPLVETNTHRGGQEVLADHFWRLRHTEGGRGGLGWPLVGTKTHRGRMAGLGLPLIFCFIFCTEIESPELFWWRFEFNYWLFEAMGLFSHPISLEIQAAYTGWNQRCGVGWARENRESKDERASEKVLKFCVWKDCFSSSVITGEESNFKRGHTLSSAQ